MNGVLDKLAHRLRPAEFEPRDAAGVKAAAAGIPGPSDE